MSDGITITISGPTHIGKTTVAIIIADQLRLIGLPVLEPEKADYHELRNHRYPALAILRSRQTPVVIEEVNIGSPGVRP